MSATRHVARPLNTPKCICSRGSVF